VEAAHVLVLQHIAPETPGLIGQALRAKAIEVRTVRPFEGERVATELGGAVGLVVMGGPMGVYDADRFPYLRDEMRLIEQALRTGCPVLGICLGSQLLAHVLGSAVVKGKRKEIGWHRVTLTEGALLDPLFKGLESSFIGFHWHGDVFDLPPGATSLARSDLTPHQAFRHGTSAYGVLFHMEGTRPIIEGMAQAFPDELAEVELTAQSILDGIGQHLDSLSERGNRVFAGWADIVAAYRNVTG
jgi:GMP synthase (glutamine-hydrolysing)